MKEQQAAARITVITPTHAASARYLVDAYWSLRKQTVQNWRWLIAVTSMNVDLPPELLADDRVRAIPYSQALFPVRGQIGQYKAALSMAAGTEYALELDDDDELFPRAIERVLAAFDAGADFVSSDCAYWRDNLDGSHESSWGEYPFGKLYGWEDPYPVSYRGMELLAQHAPPVTHQNIRRVEWSPDHLRAWRMSAYAAVGGHDECMAVGDDHDLMVRLFLSGAKFHQIPECLYAYRVRGDASNTTSRKNAEIQEATATVYNRNIFSLGEKFARDRSLLSVDLCGAHGCPPGYLALDSDPAVGAAGGVCCDLNGEWALPDESVGIIRAYDAVEHLRDPVHTMSEAFRVLAPGGFLMISVPSTIGPTGKAGAGAHCDPTHVSFWNHLSWRYYCDPRFMAYIRFAGQFQLLKSVNWYPSEWHEANNLPYVEAHLVRLGSGYRPMGALF